MKYIYIVLFVSLAFDYIAFFCGGEPFRRDMILVTAATIIALKMAGV